MSSEKLNYSELGLKVGLEIHIQLDTAHKLFCNCPTKLVEEEAEDVFIRELRPARSELGEVDIAALLEWEKGRKYEYHAPRSSSCLVEADEEPPHEINREALITAVAVAKALNMYVVDEVHVMRKVVIDGSNTSGFQRTAIIALDGYIMDRDKKIGIQTLCLEEDAARKIGEKKDKVQYKLDRLGIPLIEIATAPDINDPEEAERIAFKIGQLVRLTGKAKRGLGTIRQDLNVSIKEGAKIEIKGVQHLYLISRVVEYEALRQKKLLEIRDELRKRNISPSDISGKIFDVTDVFKNTKSKIIRRVINRKDHGVFAVILPGFKGLLGKELQPGRRFGTELADYARVWGGVGGLFHTDELPAYGISSSEVEELYKKLNAVPSRDAIVLVADEKSKAYKALNAVINRAKQAFIGVPEETRAANPDGTTKYMRPRPGSARMYPETDIPPVEITEEILREADKIVPEPLDVKLKRFIEEYGLSRELAYAIINDLRLDLFEKLVVKYKDKIPASLIASTLTNTLKMLKGEGTPIENISDEDIEGVLDKVANREIAKEAIPQILDYIARNPGTTIDEAIEKLGFKKLSMEELNEIIDKVIKENIDKIMQKPDKAFKIVMGSVMKIVRGKIDGKTVAEKVKEKLSELSR
ncbi:glutamyl-tRNA(Gln) amidotransferase subunit E [Staphylothermus marinus F1]|uniref:Glutamyl-tRNA(Gln) amidotransferase subunit E n=1 Tax=Staphylothermus marinus (strain ATCC 43588 / DSM 3639 / JCM 9404 / F1) TaxID=399550 RepID=A3DNZ1_STAMF|nr:Glu-tRNA(Gln) amidotransferase subunit GatE [Staphylothermus marinus]ABN70351.1 glutamyl-tRNA(Gln) amidotransferase subunit E [Staphylothermus marinus F1]